jgi:hypothetical protein
LKKDKRIVRRPWGRRKNGGWVIQAADLVKILREGDIAEINEIQVGSKPLRQLIITMCFPDEELLVTSNGHLEVQNIKRFIVNTNGQRKTHFRKPKRQHSFRLMNGAWLSKTATPKVTVVIKPRKF